MPSLSLTTVVLALLAPLPALAASPDAWKSFRKDVETACRVAAAPLMPEAQIVVDPFGSASYGLAFLRGLAVEDGASRALVCIYDKKARTAEIGGAMALETAMPALTADIAAPSSAGLAAVAEGNAPAAAPLSPAAMSGAAPPSPPAMAAAPPSPSDVPPSSRSQAAAALEQRFLPDAPADPAAPDSPAEIAAYAPSSDGGSLAAAFSGQCGPTCAVTLAGLAEADRRALVGLAAEVDRTLATQAATQLAAGPETARAAAAALAGSAAGQKAGAVAPPDPVLAGERSCVLYYFGYENQAARTVARHRCRVTAGADGALVVEKTSGERLRAEIRPLTEEFSAFVGRSFELGDDETAYDPDRPVSSANAELGNTVGFAAAREGRLMLVSSQRRRFADQNDFFWVLALDPA